MQLNHQYFDDFYYVFTDFNDLENYDILVIIKDSDFNFNGHFSNDFMNIVYVTSYLPTIVASATTSPTSSCTSTTLAIIGFWVLAGLRDLRLHAKPS